MCMLQYLARPSDYTGHWRWTLVYKIILSFLAYENYEYFSTTQFQAVVHGVFKYVESMSRLTK